VKLDRQQIESAMGATSDWGVRLQIELDLFERLEVYVRGDKMGRRERRRWKNFYRLEEVDVALYERLAVIFRLRGHSPLDRGVLPKTVYLKLFKNIPQQDVDMLLPGSRIKMTLLDKGRIFLPTISGVVLSLYKIVTITFVASIYGIFALLGAIAGTIGYGVKSFFGFIRTKDKYQHNLTRSLYYQNLDNNAGVLFRLLDEAEEQEFREVMIAYFVLWKKAPPGGWTLDELDGAAETLLWDMAQLRVDFEADDAVAKLDRFGLAERDEGGRWVAAPISTALQRMDATWDNYFRYHEQSEA
jgi:hypothetical protein